MNELLPYEEQLAAKLADISLPGEDPSWDAMRKMLEEDDDDDIVVPPPVQGCSKTGLALLLIVLVAGISALVYMGVHRHSGTVTVIDDSSLLEKRNTDTLTGTLIDTLTPYGKNRNAAGTIIKGKAGAVTNNGVKGNKAFVQQGSKSLVQKKAGIGTNAPANNDKKNSTVKPTNGGKNDTINANGAKGIAVKGSAITTNNAGMQTPGSDSPGLPPLATEQVKTKPGGKNNNLQTSNADTARLTQANAKQPVIKKDSSAKKAAPKEDDDKDNDPSKIWFGAGLALQQLIPVDGQKANPYNAFGRKGSMADYIPSAYFRMYRNKEFLQVEFKYGAPQYSKDIAYSSKVVSHDSATNVTTSLVNHVKKTYYHQLPVSVHYSVLPNLSIGAGFVWNKFQSAVVQQETESSQGGVITPDSTGGKIINVKSDSSFAKTYWQFMLETQYTWKRFSLGARYSWGLNPYLTYTSPVTGQTQKERNASLQIFLRYELWQSKKK